MGSSTSVIRNGDWEHQLCWVDEKAHLEQRRHLANMERLRGEEDKLGEKSGFGTKNPAYSRGNSELSSHRDRDSNYLDDGEDLARDIVMTEKDTYELVKMEQHVKSRLADMKPSCPPN